MDNIKKKLLIINGLLIIVLLCFILFNHINNIISSSANELDYIEVIDNQDTDNIFSNDIDLDELRKEYNNDNIIGRLEIPGLFNLVITQGEDNEYYLNHNMWNKKDIKGNEFLDYRNDVNDKNINIYGHNSNLYNVPFKRLEQYLDEDFFNKSKYILFQSDSGRRVYQIVAFKKVDKDYEYMNISNINQNEHIELVLKNSIYVKDIPYDNDTKTIVLQTCSMDSSDSYYILVGFEVIW